MKTVITYGTFDLFHVGHIRLLKRLRDLGDRLIVGISTDQFNMIKGKKSFFSYDERREILLACKYVDDVFPENEWEQKRDDVIKYKADIFGIGDDWKGKFDELSDVCQVVYLERTEDISTTDIKRALSKISTVECEELESSLHSALNIIKAVKSSMK